jgi:hypothetical protein
MLEDQERECEAAKRLDAFVDAAFAFAVTLLVIAGAESTTSIGALWTAVGRIPASLGAFALIGMFWLAYRDFGKIAPRRDRISTLTSLAIVFVVLVYVFPLRMLVESAFVWVSGGHLPGQAIIATRGDLLLLFRVYGLGFATQCGLFVALYGHAVRAADRMGVTPAHVQSARTSSEIWTIIAVSGALSAGLTLLPQAPFWLPGAAYWFIPLAISVHGRWRGRRGDK